MKRKDKGGYFTADSPPTFVYENEAIHNKDYSVVKTLRAGSSGLALPFPIYVYNINTQCAQNNYTPIDHICDFVKRKYWRCFPFHAPLDNDLCQLTASSQKFCALFTAHDEK